MKTILTAVAVLALSGSALATQQTVAGSANTTNVPGGSPNADGPFVYVDALLSLPAIISLDAASFELAHDYGSDVHISLQAPNGDIFNLAVSQGTGSLAASQYDIFGPFNGGFDGTHLGDGTGFGLNSVVEYSFAAAGGLWLDGPTTPPLAPGTYAAENWPVGGYAAGDWRVVVLDTFPTIDHGSLGDYSLTFTIPTPGALALFGVAGLAAARRRRA